MPENTITQLPDPSGFSADAFTDVLRNGARKLIEQAIHAELTTLMAAFSKEKLEDGRARLVRHGHLPEREVMTGIGPVPVKVPRVRDRRPGEDKITFTPSILPRYLRKAKSVEELLPWLYLKGVSTGDFSEALAALLGPNAHGLSAKTITRLKADWWNDYEAWQKRDLSHRRFLYIWADGVYFKPRMAEEKQCVLVIVGADEYGHKELLAMIDGFRESAESWRELLLDLRRRGLKHDPKLAIGDGALGFPTLLFEPYTDENGDMRSRPALDASGNPIICREAERRRDELIEHLGALAPVQGALDQIPWHFGGDAVAEVTGRKRRIVKTREGRLKVENRPASSNLGETQAFMDDAKRILIFSDAGGTGRSYHADLGAKNQRLRVHYLLEPGWKADNAIQGLGRTNRTNQAQPPLFRPVATNVKGEKRFLSTIARRLDTLGAITKGQRETGGQNMFRAEDNLESPCARAALRQFFYKLRAGKIEACSYAKFQEMTGLTLDEADGTIKENLPPIQQFLNRCLALRIDMQDAIFEAFGGFLSAIIEDARQAGTLDFGLETLRAERFEIVDRKVIFEHEATGATATALTVERTDRNDPLTLPRVKAICADTKGATLCWNTSSKRAALMVKAPAFMDEDGVPILRVKLLRPMATEILALSEFSKSHWEEIDDMVFEQLWQAEVEAVPEFTTSKITLICGLLLPIWDRLPADNMRIYRLQTEDGERAIGRLVSQEQLLNVYARLGLDSQIEMTPQEVFGAVMDAKTTLNLLSGYQLRRSLVMGQPRLELLGASGTALPGLKAMGCFTEVIQWKTRVFIPVDGTEVLARVLAEHPVGASAAEAAA